jgi:hypothetical protein
MTSLKVFKLKTTHPRHFSNPSPNKLKIYTKNHAHMLMSTAQNKESSNIQKSSNSFIKNARLIFSLSQSTLDLFFLLKTRAE